MTYVDQLPTDKLSCCCCTRFFDFNARAANSRSFRGGLRDFEEAVGAVGLQQVSNMKFGRRRS
ncbi:hypothetical protein PGT21_019544 [Puccinia graminis f. sp. tritici]|uniref:Uncharacterized protein n=1 Tax=Puccinia graminis f. sp. tritici TaxID=56615 RepID=A0A5B0NZH6_PUCGR|nr:hypothetical protein PGT21_019544 [Puccinia graminis f. sp. tritici]